MTKIDLFNINQDNISKYLYILNKTKKEFIEIHNMLQRCESYETKIDKMCELYQNEIFLSKITYNEFLIKIKHITTLNEKSLKFFKENGFKNLKFMLSNQNSPLKIFLEQNSIKFDIEKDILYLYNLEICYRCDYRYDKDVYIKSNNVKYECLSHNIFYNLNTKLNRHNGETEFFLDYKKKDMYRYSHVRKCPEILITLKCICEKLLSHTLDLDNDTKYNLINCYKNLCGNWSKKFNKTYIVTGYVDLYETNIFTHIDDDIISNIRQKQYGIKKIFDVERFIIIYSLHNRYESYNTNIATNFCAVSDNSAIRGLTFEDVTNEIKNL